jgi:hypothetical protein
VLQAAVRCRRRRHRVTPPLTGAPGAARLHGHDRRPPRYKVAAVTWLAIYPLVFGFSTLLARLELGLPPALATLLVTLGTVLLVTYAVLPVLTCVFRPWLLPTRDRKRDRGARANGRRATNTEPKADG